MSRFDTLKMLFHYNWNTVLAGWRGVGVYSPWPNDWARFPPLLTEAEILDYCYEVVADGEAQLQVAELIEELCSDEHSRASVLEKIRPLCKRYDCCALNIEMRKWRCACIASMLDDFNEKINAIDKMRAIEELFVEFGSLDGAPDNISRCDFAANPAEYYEERRCIANIVKCREWLESEVLHVRELERNNVGRINGVP